MDPPYVPSSFWEEIDPPLAHILVEIFHATGPHPHPLLRYCYESDVQLWHDLLYLVALQELDSRYFMDLPQWGVLPHHQATLRNLWRFHSHYEYKHKERMPSDAWLKLTYEDYQKFCNKYRTRMYFCEPDAAPEDSMDDLDITTSFDTTPACDDATHAPTFEPTIPCSTTTPTNEPSGILAQNASSTASIGQDSTCLLHQSPPTTHAERGAQPDSALLPLVFDDLSPAVYTPLYELLASICSDRPAVRDQITKTTAMDSGVPPAPSNHPDLEPTTAATTTPSSK